MTAHVHRPDDQGLCACGHDASPGPHVVEVTAPTPSPEEFAHQLLADIAPDAGTIEQEAMIAARDAALLAPLRAEVERLTKERGETNERHRLQLAAIEVAAGCNTLESARKQRINPSNPYWTSAYIATFEAVAREMRERVRAERAEAENARLLAHTNALLESAAENANEVTRLDAEVARLRAALQQTHGALVILLDEFSPQHMDSVSGTSVGRHAVEARNAAARALAPAAEGGTQG